jgi:hypothetical protein
MQQRGAKLILIAVGVLLDESDLQKRSQEPVHGALRQPQLARDRDHAETAVRTRERAQDRRGALNRLDVAWHRRNALSDQKPNRSLLVVLSRQAQPVVAFAFAMALLIAGTIPLFTNSPRLVMNSSNDLKGPGDALWRVDHDRGGGRATLSRGSLRASLRHEPHRV